MSGAQQPLRMTLALLAMAGLPSSTPAHSMAEVEAQLKASERYGQFVDHVAPGFTLRDPDDHPVSLVDLRGKTVVLNFLYARCRDSCPLHSALIANVQSLVAEAALADQVLFVTIATDTEDSSETAVVMREHGTVHGLDPANWVFLHGGHGREREGIELAKTYGLEFVPTHDGEQMHAVVTHVIDPEGRLRARFHGLKFGPVRLMVYVAALAHGDHAPAASAGDAGGFSQDRLALRIGLGTVFATLSVLAFGVWTWMRRRRISSDCEQNDSQKQPE